MLMCLSPCASVASRPSEANASAGWTAIFSRLNAITFAQTGPDAMRSRAVRFGHNLGGGSCCSCGDRGDYDARKRVEGIEFIAFGCDHKPRRSAYNRSRAYGDALVHPSQSSRGVDIDVCALECINAPS
jgi:hypothetical protein